MVDWGIGEYERTAAELEPVSEHVVSLAGIRPGERVVDVATGTGNAALMAARAGAVVTGLDAAPRLIDIARERAAGAGLEASFLVGDLDALRFSDGEFEVALSVFGLIFAADASRAFGEMMRVLGADGRGLMSVWVPAGPMDAVMGVLGRAMAAATGPPPARFAWHDPGVVGELAAAHGAAMRIHDGRLRISADSPEAYFAANELAHPVLVAGRPVLEQAGVYGQVREQAVAILSEANEDPEAFRVFTPYRVIEVRRAAA